MIRWQQDPTRQSNEEHILTDTKYIVVQDGPSELAIIFNPLLIHADVGRGYKVLGAGFVFVGADEVKCFGESISLNIKSRGSRDEKAVREALNF